MVKPFKDQACLEYPPQPLTHGLPLRALSDISSSQMSWRKSALPELFSVLSLELP